MLQSVIELFSRVDVFFFNLFNQGLKCRFFDLIMPLFTHLAGFASVVGICLFLTLFFPSIPGPPILGAVFFAQIAAQSLKYLVKRLRPHIRLANVNIFQKLMHYDPSFPSAHTATIVALGQVVAAMQPAYESLIAFLCIMVGVSRIYLGQHYPGDVLVGAVIGLLAAQLSCYLFV